MAGINSRTYWEARQTAIVLFGEKKTKDIERTIKAAYNGTTRDIQKEITNFYQKYADEDGVTTQAIRRRLTSKELATFKDAAGNYITEIDKYKEAPPQLIAHQSQLKRLSAKAYVTRLEELKMNIDHKLNMMNADTDTGMGEHLEDIYEDAYYHMLHNIQSSAKLGTSFTQPGQQQLKTAVRTKWNGANYSDRIWANKDKLVAQLDVIIPQSFVRGMGSAVLGRQLAETMDVAYSSAVRLIRTESRFVGNRGTKDAYVESGVVDEIMFMATLDDRTSVICQEMDGTIMDVKDGNPGVTMPPLHPYCRSTTIPYFPDDEIGALLTDRVSRKDGKTFKMGKYQNYKAWAAENAPASYVSRLTTTDEVVALAAEPTAAPAPVFDWGAEFDDAMDEAVININGELQDKKHFVEKYFKPYEEADNATRKKIALDVADYNAKHLSWNHESIDGKSMAAYESARKNPDRIMSEYKKILAQHMDLAIRSTGGSANRISKYGYLDGLDDKQYAYLERIVQAGKAGVIKNIEKIKAALPNAKRRRETLWNSGQAGGGDVGEDALMKIMLDGTDQARMPDLVSVSKFNELVNKSGVIPIQRGLKGAQFAHQYKKGEMYYGKGVFGNGTYTAVDKETAMVYGGVGRYGKEALISIGLRPDANLIAHSQLRLLVQGMRNAGSKFRTIERTFGIEAWGLDRDDLELLTEEGRLAAALGFDGIYVEDADFLILLGRDKVYVSEEAVVIDW